MNKVKVRYSSTSATALKFRGSVIRHVLPKVAFFLGWSLFVLAMNTYVLINQLRMETSLITLLGLVISLLLVFRTNTAYDRYWEGRRLWSELSMAVRSLSRVIWVHVDEQNGRYGLDVKRRVLYLLIAYAYACKLYLRGELSAQHPELQNYISHIPGFCKATTLEESSNSAQLASLSKRNISLLPILIAHHISSFIADTLKDGAISAPVCTSLINSTNVLMSSLTGFERILTTPIPTAYAVHLSQTIWIFCLFLPFQVLNMLKTNDWIMVVVVCLVVFTMFGIVNIGEEIENPFGLDANDLPLSEYCTILHTEIEAIIKRPPPSSNDWPFHRPTPLKPSTQLHTSFAISG